MFSTSDALPGRVLFSDHAYVPSWEDSPRARPGIAVIPPDASEIVTPPGIGAIWRGVAIDGGKNLGGGSSYIGSEPSGNFIRTYRDGGGLSSEIATLPGKAHIRTFSGDGDESGWVRVRPKDAELAYVNGDNGYLSRIKADPNEAFIYTEAGGARRYLTVDADGIWVKTTRSGKWEMYNLEETANDSGWIRFNAHSGISTGNDPGLRLKGGIVWAQGYVTRPDGWPKGWTRIAGSFAEWLRPTRDILRQGATTASQRQILRMTSTGYIEVWWSDAAPGSYQVDLSPLSFPNS